MKGVLLAVVALAVSVVVLMSFGGSVNGQKQQFYRCELDALKQFPNDPGGPVSTTAAFLEYCMGSAGFEIPDGDTTLCPYGDPSRRNREYCYAPMSAQSRCWQRAQKWLSGRI